MRETGSRKHKVQHKFEIKTAVLLNLFCFSFAQKPNRDPPTLNEKNKSALTLKRVYCVKKTDNP